MLIRLIRWFRGYVLFRASGKHPERFINIINKSGINYWGFIPEGKNYIGSMLLYDYKNIRPLAFKSSVKLKSVKRAGLPFFLKKYKARKGLAAGAVLALIILSFLSNYMWDVKINGLNNISEAKMNYAMEECGLKRGELKSSLNFESIERKLLLKLPEIRWISINAVNCIAEVEIKEKYKKPKLKKEKTPCNLVASDDGVITKPIAKSGTCAVKKGSAVIKNQLLISCVVKGTNEQENKLRFVPSNGKVFADVKYKKEFIIPKTNNRIMVNSDYIEKSNLKLLRFEFPVAFNSSDSESVLKSFYHKNISRNGVTLPLGLNSIRIYDMKIKKNKLVLKTAKILLKKKALLSQAFNIGKFKIVKSKNSIKELKDAYKLKCAYLINKNIAVKQKVKIIKKVE